MKNGLVRRLLVVGVGVFVVWAFHEPAGGAVEEQLQIAARAEVGARNSPKKRPIVDAPVAASVAQTSGAPVEAPPKLQRVLAVGNCPSDGGIARGCARCATDADCPQGLGCGVDEAGGLSCLATECDWDADCSGARACRIVSMTGTGSEVRQCRGGFVGEGKRCDVIPNTETTACEPGLLCGVDEKCAKTCATPADCRQGESCVRHPLEKTKLCAKVCAADYDCPSQQTCVGLGEMGAYCRRVTHGPNCQRDGCAPGQSCQMFETFPKHVGFQCAQCCNPLDAASCGAGFVCGKARSGGCTSVCYKACKTPFDCVDGGQGVACASVDEGLELTGCVPHISRAVYLKSDGGPMSLDEMKRAGLNVRDVYE